MFLHYVLVTVSNKNNFTIFQLVILNVQFSPVYSYFDHYSIFLVLAQLFLFETWVFTQIDVRLKT